MGGYWREAKLVNFAVYASLYWTSEMQFMHFSGLIPVMLGLVRPFKRDAQIIGLLFGQFGQLHADFFQMQSRHFFIQLFRQTVNANFVAVFVRPKIELRKDLIGERVRHDE